MTKIRWGLLSTANINRRLIPAIRNSRRGQLVAVASRNRAKSLAYAAQWQIPQAFDSYEAMLESDEVDAVYISLPNHLHAEWTVKALQQGKHVLCEKPFAISLAEVDEMIGAAQTTGRVLSEAFMYRHHPQTKVVGEWVSSGRIGDIKLVRATFNFQMANPDNVRLVPAWGGGCLWDVGIYPISFSQYLLGGRPEWVIGDQWLGPTGVDEAFAGQMHYTGGRVAQISSSFCSPFHTSAEIIGTAGRLTLNRPFVGMVEEGEMWWYPAGGSPELITFPKPELYAGEVSDMHEAILEGKAPYLTLAESRNHVHTALALYESAKTGQIVTLND